MEGMPRRPSASGDEGPSEPEKEKPLSRRTILKTYLAGAATVAPVIYEVERIENGNELAPAEHHVSKAERKSIAHLETSSAFYTIQFAAHNLMSPPEVLSGKDALLLELVTDFDSKKAVMDIVDEVGFEDQSSSRWHPYTDLLQEAFRRGTPVYFVDMINDTAPHISNDVYEKDRRAAILKKVETAIGGAAMGASVLLSGPETLESSVGIEHPKRSRRTFMRMAGKSGLAGFAAWALSRIPQEIAGDAARPPRSIPNEQSAARHIQEDLGNLNYEVHPETRSMIIDMRNALIAQKSETVARLLEEKLGRKPRLALEIGADHFGIERELLKKDPERVNELKQYLGENLHSQNLIVRIQTVTGIAGGQKLDVTFLHDPAIEHADH